MAGARQRSAGAVDSTSGGARGVASVDGVSARSNQGAVRPPQTGRIDMAKKTKKTGGKGKTETQRKAEQEVKEASAKGAAESTREAPKKAEVGAKDKPKAETSAGDAPAEVQAKAASGKGKGKGKAEDGEPKAFSTHLHDYDIGQPKPETWDEPKVVDIPGGGKINVTLYYGRFGEAKNLDDDGVEIPFERKADRTKWLNEQKTAWRRSQGGTALRQKCRGRLRAIISKVKYVGVHQGAIITEEQNAKVAQAQGLLEEVYAGINEKGILVDPKTGDVLDHELNKIAQAAEKKAS